MPRDKQRAAATYKKRDAKRCERTGTTSNPKVPQPNSIAPHITAANLTSPEVCAHVTALLARGTGDALVRDALGCTAPAFAKLIEGSPQFAAAVEKGRALAEQLLTDRLRDIAMSEDRMAAPSAMFLLKAKHGLSDRGDSAQRGAPQVVINLPGALAPAEYARLVESESLLVEHKPQ